MILVLVWLSDYTELIHYKCIVDILKVIDTDYIAIYISCLTMYCVHRENDLDIGGIVFSDINTVFS